MACLAFIANNYVVLADRPAPLVILLSNCNCGGSNIREIYQLSTVEILERNKSRQSHDIRRGNAGSVSLRLG